VALAEIWLSACLNEWMLISQTLKKMY